MVPGQYFVLKFDFSRVYRGRNMKTVVESLQTQIGSAYVRFYDTYAEYLGGNAEKYSDYIKHSDPSVSLSNCGWLVKLLEARGDPKSSLADVKGVRNRSFLVSILPQ